MFYLTKASEIQAIITEFASRQILWLDTEVADYDTRFPKLSLIQVLAEPNDLAGDSVYILDVFKQPDVVEYFIAQIMANAKIEKVFHYADFDLRYLGGNIQAQNVTCTLKIAKKISRDRLGTSNLKLKTLARELCNFTDVDEEEGRSDWGRRPLSQKQLNYAKMDTIYLAQVHLRLNRWGESNAQLSLEYKTPDVLDNSHNLMPIETETFGYFGEGFPGNSGNCDNYLSPEPVQDWTIEAMKFLSCVARCKERFGMLHIIDVLRGGKTQKITQHEHDKLSTYGIGKDKSVDEWRMLGRSLLHQGLLEQTSDDYPILKLNALSWEVLHKQRTVSITIPVVQKITWEDGNKKAAEVEMLMQRLRALRQQLAEEQSVRPYLIFQNSTLELMAQVQPQTKEEFSKLSGVGSHKLAQYADKFLAEICAYRIEQDLLEQLEQADLDRQIQSVEFPNHSEDFDKVDKLIETETFVNIPDYTPKYLPEKCQQLIDLSQRKIDLKKYAEQLDGFTFRQEKITNAVREIQPIIIALRVFRQKGIINFDLNQKVDTLLTFLTSCEENFRKNPEWILDRNNFQGNNFTSSVVTLKTTLRKNLCQAWKSYLTQHLPSINKEMLNIFIKLESLKPTIERIYILNRQIQEIEFPKNSEDFDRVDKLIEELKQSLDSLSSDKIPEDVQNFLKAAANQGATIDLLTLEVKEWLIQHRLAESLRIRLT